MKLLVIQTKGLPNAHIAITDGDEENVYGALSAHFGVVSFVGNYTEDWEEHSSGASFDNTLDGRNYIFDIVDLKVHNYAPITYLRRKDEFTCKVPMTNDTWRYGMPRETMGYTLLERENLEKAFNESDGEYVLQHWGIVKLGEQTKN